MPKHWKDCLYTWQYSGSKEMHSQCGQDLIVEYITPPNSNRTFIDFGANDGVTGSSTFQLEQRGWRGLLVEPSLEHVSSLLNRRSKSHLLPVAVSASSGIAKFASGTANTLNTLLVDPNTPQFKRLCHASNDQTSIKYVPTLSVEDILKVFNGYFSSEPDFVKIDVEGLELNVISDLMKCNCIPSIIEVENNKRESYCADILLANGYRCEIIMDSFVEIYTQKKIDKEKIFLIMTQ